MTEEWEDLELPLPDDPTLSGDTGPDEDVSPTPSPQRRKGRTSAVELEARIEFTAFLLSRKANKSAIKQQLNRLYGVDFHTAERYLSRAREILVERTGRPKEDHVVDAYSFYTSVIQNPRSTELEK